MKKSVSSRLIILSAPSGAGKTSLSKKLIQEHNDIKIAVSHTTRKPRPSEKNGQDYYFIDKAEFDEIIGNDGFLEYAQVFDQSYGTSKASVQELLDDDLHVLLEIDWQGAQNIREIMPDTTSIFILPPSKHALYSRLKARGQDSEEIIERRMRDAQNQISHYLEYEKVIINDNFDQAYQELESIIYGYNHPPSLDQIEMEIFVQRLMKNES